MLVSPASFFRICGSLEDRVRTEEENWRKFSGGVGFNGKFLSATSLFFFIGPAASKSILQFDEMDICRVGGLLQVRIERFVHGGKRLPLGEFAGPEKSAGRPRLRPDRGPTAGEAPWPGPITNSHNQPQCQAARRFSRKGSAALKKQTTSARFGDRPMIYPTDSCQNFLGKSRKRCYDPGTRKFW